MVLLLVGSRSAALWSAGCGAPPSIKSSSHYSFGLSWLCTDWVSCRHAKKKVSKLIRHEIQYICQITRTLILIINQLCLFVTKKGLECTFPHLEIQSDLHSNYAAFRMNHGLTPQCQCPARLLARSRLSSTEMILALGGRIWGVIEVNPFTR